MFKLGGGIFLMFKLGGGIFLMFKLDSSLWCFEAYNSPFWISGADMGFLKIPLTRKDYNIKENREQSSSYKPPYISSTCSTTRCQKNCLERHQSLETITEKKKENQTGKKMGENL